MFFHIYFTSKRVCAHVCVCVWLLSARSTSHLGHTGAVLLRWLHHQLDLATQPPFLSTRPLCFHFSCFHLNIQYKAAALLLAPSHA